MILIGFFGSKWYLSLVGDVWDLQIWAEKPFISISHPNCSVSRAATGDSTTEMFVSAGLSFPNDVQIFVIDHLPSAAQVLEMVVQGSIRAAAIDSMAVLSSFHLQTAIAKALHNASINTMRTKNTFSEIIYCLSATRCGDTLWFHSPTHQNQHITMMREPRNISESFKRCGVSASTSRLILVFIDPTTEDLSSLQSIGGSVVNVQELGKPLHLFCCIIPIIQAG